MRMSMQFLDFNFQVCLPVISLFFPIENSFIVSEHPLLLQAEGTVISQCQNLLSPSADPAYVTTYINHSFPQHRKYLCAGAWILMQGHPENINSTYLVNIS